MTLLDIALTTGNRILVDDPRGAEELTNELARDGKVIVDRVEVFDHAQKTAVTLKGEEVAAIAEADLPENQIVSH
jgi:hypothetical protein